MKRYPAWQVVYRSFYSLDFYRNVAVNWNELGFVHLWLLAGFNWLVLATSLHFALGLLCDKVLMPLAEQVPTVTSANGKFSIDKPSPYSIKDPNSGKAIFTFDTTGKTKSLDSAGFLMTDDSVLIFTGAGNTEADRKEVVTTAMTGPGVVSASNIRDLVTMLRTTGAAIFFIFGWMFGTIFLFVQALFYAVGGIIFSAISGTKLTYIQLVRLSAVAITPAVILDTIVRLTPGVLNPSTELPYKLIGFAISMAYLIAAIVACKKLFSPPLESVFASTPGTSDPLHNASTGEALDESSEPGVIPPDTPLA